MCKFPMPSSHFALQITATRKIPKIHTYYKCQFHACVGEKNMFTNTCDHIWEGGRSSK